jgi:hypothetical protein
MNFSGLFFEKVDFVTVFMFKTKKVSLGKTGPKVDFFFPIMKTVIGLQKRKKLHVILQKNCAKKMELCIFFGQK